MPIIVDEEGEEQQQQEQNDENVEEPEEQPSVSHLHSHSFNQGYYGRFFIESKKLGRGLRGCVYLCQHVLDDIYLGEYAIKKVAVGDNHPWLARMLREVHLLEKLHHPNIVNYKHAWLENHRQSPFGPEIPSLFILMECANGGNLEEYINVEERVNLELATLAPRDRAKRMRHTQQQGWASWKQAFIAGGIGIDQLGRKVRYLKTEEIWLLLRDIVSGLEHLHKHGIVHRDLKPPNLLLSYVDPQNKNQTPRALISDFGECEMLSEDALRTRSGATGTIDFTAPELLQMDENGLYRNDYSEKADIWSLGLIIYYLCFSSLPYRQLDNVDQLREEILSFSGNVPFPDNDAELVRVPRVLRQIIVSCMSVNPKHRPSASELMHALERLQNQQPQHAHTVVRARKPSHPQNDPLVSLLASETRLMLCSATQHLSDIKGSL